MTEGYDHKKTTSVSSLSSDESTRDLIESLETETRRKEREETFHKLDASGEKTTLEPVKITKLEPQVQGSQESIFSTTKVLPASDMDVENKAHAGGNNVGVPSASTTATSTTSTTTQTPAIPIKKAIKFTVRKVSHETVKSPEPNSYIGGGHQSSGSRSTSDSNNSPTFDSNANAIQVQKNVAQSQEKYDQYTKKIEKIDKEIIFLKNLLPPYNVEIDYATRTKITNAVEKLKMKQDELEKKKYSLGITISRLWRSMDDNDIWVRSMGKQ